MIGLVEIQDATVQVFLGELTVAEAMACKIPCIVPDYSVLSEWPNGGVHYIPIDRRAPWHNPQMINTTHYFFQVDPAIEALEYLYQHKQYRNELAQKGYDIVTKKEFAWKSVAMMFHELFQSVKSTPKVARPVMNVTPKTPQVKVWEKK